MHFCFDIDQTILFLELSDKKDDILNQIPCTPVQYNPYSRILKEKNLKDAGCYVLNKEKIKKIFQCIVDQGHTFDFITAGSLHIKEMKTFFQKEFDIILDENCACYNPLNFNKLYVDRNGTERFDKTVCLKAIASKRNLEHSAIYLVDDSAENIRLAAEATFNTIYVDSNKIEPSNGENYIKALEHLLRLDIQKEKTPEFKTTPELITSELITIDLEEPKESCPPSEEKNAFLLYTGRKCCCHFFKLPTISNPIPMLRRFINR